MSVSEEIIKVIDALAKKMGMVIDWTSQNVIPYIEQLCGKYVTYEMATSIIWAIFGIVCLFVGKWLIKKSKYCYKKHCETEYNDWDVAMVFSIIGSGATILTGVIIIMNQLFDITTCLVFPEKIILDELKNLISVQ